MKQMRLTALLVIFNHNRGGKKVLLYEMASRQPLSRMEYEI